MRRPMLPQGCCTTPSAVCLWAAAFVLFYGAGLLLGTVWPAVRHYGDTVLFVSLAAACFVNFHRNRTLHCALTGPLFVVSAIVAFMSEAGIWHVDLSTLGGVVLLGVGLAFVLEWRTVGRNSEA